VVILGCPAKRSPVAVAVAEVALDFDIISTGGRATHACAHAASRQRFCSAAHL